MLRMMLLLALTSFATSSMIDMPNANPPNCSMLFGAPYDISLSPIIEIAPIMTGTGSYYLHPCGVLDTMRCAGQQQCYYNGTSWMNGNTIGLGTTNNTSWSQDLSKNWAAGIIARTMNFVVDPSSSLCQSNVNTNSFSAHYWCGENGDDSAQFISQPRSATDPCIFYAVIDSSIICNYIKSLSSSSSGGSISSSGAALTSSSSSGSKRCSASYQAPFDLSLSPAITAPSPYWRTGQGVYAIQPCGAADLNLCPDDEMQQQCFAVSTWEREADPLGASDNTIWQPVHVGDWTQGIVAVNNDIPWNYDQCTSVDGVSSFTTTFMCDKGDDSMTVVKEPIDRSGPCVFEMRVDSSVICAWVATQPSTGGHRDISSSTGSADEQVKEGLSVALTVVVAVSTLVVGLVAGLCVAMFVMRRKQVSSSDSYDERLV